MTSIRQRRKDLPENRRACILKAARCVFARQSYADTVVDDIAVQAGIGKGTLYLYFKSKEDIFLAAVTEDARCLVHQTRERMHAADRWEEKLKAYMHVRLEYLETHQDFLRMYLAEIRGRMLRGLLMPPDLLHIIRESEGQLAQVFAAAAARNEIRSLDPELAALTVSDLTHGLIERRLLGWSRITGSADAEFALDLLCRSLKA